MASTIPLHEISIRTSLQPGDLGYVMYRHGRLYGEEYGYGPGFEAYVGAGLHEFYSQYDPARDATWICAHGPDSIGFLLCMHRPDNAAQLRYFYLERAYRGLGLGSRLLQLFLQHLQDKGYRSAYLWTTAEQVQAAALYTRYGFVRTAEKPSTTFGKPLLEQRYDLFAVPPSAGSSR